MVTAETLTLAALLIAPGVVAVLIGVTLGVVEQEVGRDRFYLTSFISSIFIDVVFIWVVQTFGEARVTNRATLEGIFFGEQQFNVGAAVLLFILSCSLGLIYAIGLTYNTAHFSRELLGKFTTHKRNPWQPWVGGLRDAEQVMVELESGSDVVGMLAEYSRVEKERQIVLQSPVFTDLDEEKPNREKIIIAEEEIQLVHVMTTRERKGLRDKVKELTKSSESDE